jgi:hypothetical protein
LNLLRTCIYIYLVVLFLINYNNNDDDDDDDNTIVILRKTKKKNKIHDRLLYSRDKKNFRQRYISRLWFYNRYMKGFSCSFFCSSHYIGWVKRSFVWIKYVKYREWEERNRNENIIQVFICTQREKKRERINESRKEIIVFHKVHAIQ